MCSDVLTFKIFKIIFVAFVKKQTISTFSYNFSSNSIIFATHQFTGITNVGQENRI
jgi:hypothetical protein